MDFLTAIFQAIAQIIPLSVNAIVEAFTGVQNLWFSVDATSGDVSLTLLGVLSLIAFVFGIVWLAIRFIGSLVSMKQAR